MNEGNFIASLSGIVSGDRFLKEVELPLLGAVRITGDGEVPLDGTAPSTVATGLSWANGEQAWLHFNIPQDYDEAVDACALRLHEVPAADHADTTDLGILAEQDIYRAGAAVAADPASAVAVAETAVASTGALVRENVLDISNRGYKPGDHVVLVLDANSDGTELILLGIDLIYGSCIRAYNENDYARDIGTA